MRNYFYSSKRIMAFMLSLLLMITMVPADVVQASELQTEIISENVEQNPVEAAVTDVIAPLENAEAVTDDDAQTVETEDLSSSEDTPTLEEAEETAEEETVELEVSDEGETTSDSYDLESEKSVLINNTKTTSYSLTFSVASGVEYVVYHENNGYNVVDSYGITSRTTLSIAAGRQAIITNPSAETVQITYDVSEEVTFEESEKAALTHFSMKAKKNYEFINNSGSKIKFEKVTAENGQLEYEIYDTKTQVVTNYRKNFGSVTEIPVELANGCTMVVSNVSETVDYEFYYPSVYDGGENGLSIQETDEPALVHYTLEKTKNYIFVNDRTNSEVVFRKETAGDWLLEYEIYDTKTEEVTGYWKDFGVIDSSKTSKSEPEILTLAKGCTLVISNLSDASHSIAFPAIYSGEGAVTIKETETPALIHKTLTKGTNYQIVNPNTKSKVEFKRESADNTYALEYEIYDTESGIVTGYRKDFGVIESQKTTQQSVPEIPSLVNGRTMIISNVSATVDYKICYPSICSEGDGLTVVETGKEALVHKTLEAGKSYKIVNSSVKSPVVFGKEATTADFALEYEEHTNVNEDNILDVLALGAKKEVPDVNAKCTMILSNVSEDEDYKIIYPAVRDDLTFEESESPALKHVPLSHDKNYQLVNPTNSSIPFVTLSTGKIYADYVIYEKKTDALVDTRRDGQFGMNALPTLRDGNVLMFSPLSENDYEIAYANMHDVLAESDAKLSIEETEDPAITYFSLEAGKSKTFEAVTYDVNIHAVAPLARFDYEYHMASEKDTIPSQSDFSANGYSATAYKNRILTVTNPSEEPIEFYYPTFQKKFLDIKDSDIPALWRVEVKPQEVLTLESLRADLMYYGVCANGSSYYVEVIKNGETTHTYTEQTNKDTYARYVLGGNGINKVGNEGDEGGDNVIVAYPYVYHDTPILKVYTQTEEETKDDYINIAMNLTMRNASEDGPITLENPDYRTCKTVVKNKETGNVISYMKTKDGLKIPKNAVKMGDVLLITMERDGYVTENKEPVELLVGSAALEASFVLNECPQLIVRDNSKESRGVMVNVYKKVEGQPLDLLYAWKRLPARGTGEISLEEGEFTILAIRTDITLRMADYHQVENMALAEDTGYILRHFTVENGKIYSQEVGDLLPQNVRDTDFINNRDSYVSAGTKDLPVGEFTEVTVHYEFDQNVMAGVTMKGILVDVPRGLEFIEKSVSGDTTGEIKIDDKGKYFIPVDKNEGTVRYSVKATQMNPIIMMENRARFDYFGEEKEETIGTVEFNSAGDSILYTSQYTSGDEIFVHGIVSQYTDVNLYLNEDLVKTIRSNASGFWSYTISVKDNWAPRYWVKAVINEGTEEEVSKECEVRWSEEGIQLNDFSLYYYDHDNVMKEKDLLDDSASKVIAFFPRYELVYAIDVENDENVEGIKVVSNSSSGDKAISAIKDEQSGKWYAKGYFDPNQPSMYHPQNVHLEYEVNEEKDWEKTLGEDKLKEILSKRDEVCKPTYTKIDETENSASVKVTYTDGPMKGNSHTVEIAKTDFSTQKTPYFDDYGAFYYSNKNYVLKVYPSSGNRSFVSPATNYYTHRTSSSNGSGGFRGNLDTVNQMFGNTLPMQEALDMYDITTGRYDSESERSADLIKEMSYITMETVCEEVAKNEFLDALGSGDGFGNWVTENFGNELWEGAKQAAQEAWEKAKEAWDNAKEKVKEGWEKAKEALQGWWNKYILDPSGVVYEVSPAHPVTGVTATLYCKGEGGEAIKWDAEEYEQVNPIITDQNGFYRWDVPEGSFQVKYEKEGYEPVFSEWMEVPPPRLDVNVEMKSLAAPAIESSIAKQDGIHVSFNKHVDIASLDGKVKLTIGGQDADFTLKSENAEDYKGAEVTRELVLVPTGTLQMNQQYGVTIAAGAKTYAGVANEAQLSVSGTMKPYVTGIEINAEDRIFTYPDDKDFVLDGQLLGNGITDFSTYKVNVATEFFLKAAAPVVNVKEDGTFEVALHCEIPGTSKVTLSVEGTDISVIMDIVDDYQREEYTLLFDTQGGNEIPRMITTGLIDSLPIPEKDDSSFLGWFTEAEGGVRITENDTVKENMVLFAHWQTLGKYVVAPVASVASGTEVEIETVVSLSTSTEGATIHYTVDGSVPTEQSPIYNEEITITKDTIIKAIAVKEGLVSSKVSTFVYTLIKEENYWGDILQEDRAAYADPTKVPDKVWVAGVKEAVYTGKAITLNVRVYDYKTLLKEGVDYKVTYKNNIKACEDVTSSKAPEITITGMGNYVAVAKDKFVIHPCDMSKVSVEPIILPVKGGKRQTPAPVLTYKGTKLKNNTDYKVYFDGQEDYTSVGDHWFRVVGNGNFTETKYVKMTITDKTLMSGASIVGKLPNLKYNDGKEVKHDSIRVAYKGTDLKEKEDYTVSYENNKEVGTATLILTGKGKYIGQKKVNFKVEGIALAKAKVTFDAATVYTGEEIKLPVKVTYTDPATRKEEPLAENEAYSLSYENHVKAGSATIVLTGKGKFSGVVKKKFKILPYDINGDDIQVIAQSEAPYQKGGSQNPVTVTFKGKVLTAGVDYKVTYKNNAKVGTEQNKATIVLTGKGNFKGSRQRETFIVQKQNLANLSMRVSDKVYQNKVKNFVPTFTIFDANGKALSAGADYNKNTISYTYLEDTAITRKVDGNWKPVTVKANDFVTENDIVPVGANIQVTVNGAGAYEGTITGTFRMIAVDIGKAKFSIPNQEFTGRPIVFSKEKLMTFYTGKTPLMKDQFIIVKTENNVKAGKATITVKGVGEYGGTKTIEFKIVSKKFR